MMTKLMTVAAFSACMTLGAGTAWSCSMAGPNTHIGPVTAVDAEANTFTVLDAETRHIHQARGQSRCARVWQSDKKAGFLLR